MPIMFTHDAALRLFEAGEFGTLAKISTQLNATAPGSVRLLVAHALARSGDPHRALEWAAASQGLVSSLLWQAQAPPIHRTIPTPGGQPLEVSIVAGSTLSDQLRQGPVIADEILGAAGEVGELRGGDVDPQTLVERGENVAEMNRPGVRLLAPARR